MSGADQFQEYYQEFCSILKKVLDGDGSSDDDLQECTTLLQQMKLEARGRDDEDELMERIKLYRSQLKSIKEKQSQRDTLFARTTTQPTTTTSINSQHHEKLAHAEASLHYQQDSLERARRTLAETEEVAAATLDELQTQRETLQSTREKTDALSSLTRSANGIISNMSKPWWMRKKPSNSQSS